MIFSGWVIVDGDDDDYIDLGIPYYSNETDSDLPPSSGWEVQDAVSPAPAVFIAGPAVTYSSDTFFESDQNDGMIDNSSPITIVLNNFGGETFTGDNGNDFVADGKILVSNLPSGLSAVATRTSSTELGVILSGTAGAHANPNDVADLTFAFQNSAFTGGDASAVSNSEKSDLGVNFIEMHTVGSGLDFETIQGAIDDSGVYDFDILSLAAETFTEPDIEITSKSIIIKGQGAGQTIVQANESYNSGCDSRVFYFHTSRTTFSVRLENMTVRHGDISTDLLGAGGISVGGDIDLTIRNCEITKNRNEYRSYGGGLKFYGRSLLIEDSTISHNTAFYKRGGGIYFYGDVGTIRNCTISGNELMSTGEGGGGLGASSSIVIENTTIANNSSGTVGDGVRVTNGDLRLKNTIIANNGTQDIYRYSGTVSMENCIYETLVNGLNGGDDIDNQVVDPMLGALAYNDGSSTATHALEAGSQAIGAGTSSGIDYFTDQNGKAHVGHPDVGSYEYHGQEGASADWIGSASSDDISGGPLLEADDGDTPIAALQIDPGTGAASFTVERFDSSCGSACPANFWWNAEVTGDFAGDLTFFYDDSQLNGMAEADLKLYHWNGEAWENRGGDVDVDANSITVHDVTEENFSPFALNVSDPNIVVLGSFEALYGSDGALLTWETGSEIDNAGFRIWRSGQRDGQYVLVSDELVAATGDALSGGSYSFLDDSADGTGYYYKLEDIDYSGRSTFHAPTVRKLSLEAGWNILDGDEFAGVPVAQALAPIAGDFASVWGLSEGGWRKFNPQQPELSDLEVFEAGGDCWIYMRREAELLLP